MQSREIYERAVAIVASVVREWDPYALLAAGAPPDEFEAEIAKVVTYVPHIRNAHDATQALSSVFSAAFEPHLFTPAACAQQGTVLFARLVAAGLAVHA